MSNTQKIFTIETARNIYKFEDALALTGFGKYNILVTLLCGFLSFSGILETIGFGFILSASQCDLDLSLAQKGLLGAIPFIGIALTSQLWGYLADTRGRRKMLMTSVCLAFVCSIISSLAPNFIVFLLIRLFSAAFMCPCTSVAFAYFGELIPKSHADIMISVLSSIVMGSTIIATGIAWGVLSLKFSVPIYFLGFNYRPWRLLVICFGIPFILAFMALIKAPESPKYLMSRGKNKRVLKILRQMYEMNSGKDSSTYPVVAVSLDEQDELVNDSKKESSVWSQTAPIFKPPLLKYTLILFTVAFTIYGSGNSTFVWLPGLLDRFYAAVERGDIDGKTFCEIISQNPSSNKTSSSANESITCNDSVTPDTYISMLAFTSIVTFTNLVVIFLLRCVPKKIILVFIMGISALSTAGMYFVTNVFVSWALLIIYTLSGVLVGIMTAFTVEIFPTNYRAMAVSTILLVGRMGSISCTNLIGLLLETNCDLSFFIFCILFTVTCVCGFFLPDSKKKTNVESTKL